MASHEQYSEDARDVHLDADGQPRIVERWFTVEPELAGVRLDQFLKQKIPRLSRNKLQRIIRSQLTDVDGRRLQPNHRVAPGLRLVIRRPAQAEPPCPRSFRVLYQDGDLLVIDKPAGLPVHSSARYYFNTLTHVLRERYPDEPELQICHRLDRETSGCLVVARHRTAAKVLKRAFEDHRVHKTYVAIVHGQPAWTAPGIIDLPLGLTDDPDAHITIRMVVRDDALPAQTRVTVLDRGDGVALLQCEPITGRQHQIRAHLAAVGHPIVGDKLYAHGDQAFAAACDGSATPEQEAAFLLPRHALHAARIHIPHPSSGETIIVNAQFPDDLAAFFRSRQVATGGPGGWAS